MGSTSTYPVSITTLTGAVRLHCGRCGAVDLLLLTEQEIDWHVPLFLSQHPDGCLANAAAPG